MTFTNPSAKQLKNMAAAEAKKPAPKPAKKTFKNTKGN